SKLLRGMPSIIVALPIGRRSSLGGRFTSGDTRRGYKIGCPDASGGPGNAFRRGPGAHRLALMTDGDWRDGGFRQRRPSVDTLAWVAASMGRGSRVVGYRRLTGGVCSAVNRLTVERHGKRTFVVLRQYPGGFGLQGSLEKEIAN